MATTIKNTVIKNTTVRPPTSEDYYSGIPQPKQWLDITDESTMQFRTATDFVEKVTDKSGNGYDGTSVQEAAQATYLRNEFNGHNVLKFIGIDDVLNFVVRPFTGGNTPYTVIMIMKSDSINAANLFLNAGTTLATDRCLHFRLIGNVLQTDWLNNTLDSSTTLDTVNYWSLISDYDGTDRNHYTNGVNDATDTPGIRNSSGGAAQAIRGNSGSNMYLAEYIMYDRVLTPTELAQVNTYVLNKYGIS